MEFAPQKRAHPALHVDDVEAARAELEAKGVERRKAWVIRGQDRRAARE